MPDVTASRTLVKSAPELWTECSDADSLGRHLDGFGDIRITRLEPETAVAWEGEHASGTVRLEPSGWGTRVVLTATPAPGDEPPATMAEPVAVAPVVVPESVEVEVEVAEPESEPVEVAEPEPEPRRGFFARLFGRKRRPVPLPEPDAVVDPEPEPVAAPEPEPAPVAIAEPEPSDAAAALHAALDSLGAAHHRPYSRS